MVSAEVDILNEQFWRDLASAVCPDEKSEWHRNELACILKDAATAFGEEWPKISRQCDKNSSNSVRVGMTAFVDRADAVHKAGVVLSAAEKWVSNKQESEVCDPQQELAMLQEGSEAEAATKGEEPETDGAE